MPTLDEWGWLAREMADALLDHAKYHSNATRQRLLNLNTKFCRLRTDELRSAVAERTNQPGLFEDQK